MSKEWKPGDMVRHKTGGPKMCVGGHTTRDGHFVCITRWFEPGAGVNSAAISYTPSFGKAYEAWFHPDELEAL